MAKKRKKMALGGQITGGTPDIQAFLENDRINTAKAHATAENHWGVKALDIASDLAFLVGANGGIINNKAKSPKSKIEVKPRDLSNYQIDIPKIHSFASGGVVPIEAEGGEIVEQPGQKPIELQGPSHEEGGMPMDVAPNTEIFSDRLTGPDGKTMAERKKMREKKTKQLKRLAEQNKFNEVLTNTVERTLLSLEQEELEDMQYMQAAQELMQSQEEAMNAVQEFALGGVVDGDFEEQAQMAGMSVPEFAQHIIENKDEFGISLVKQAEQYSSLRQEFATGGKVLTNVGNYLANNFGDIFGGASILYGAREQLRNTKNMRASDLPVVDHMKDVQSSADENFSLDKQNLQRTYDAQESALQRQLKNNMQSIRNSARGVNQLRALSINAQEGNNLNREKAYGNFLTSLNQLMAQRNRSKDELKTIKARNATVTDMRRAENQDAYYTALSQNLADKSRATQQFAKHINQMGVARTQGRLLAHYSKYGIHLDAHGNARDRDGNIISLDEIYNVD